jgi:hypothetical protein
MQSTTAFSHAFPGPSIDVLPELLTAAQRLDATIDLNTLTRIPLLADNLRPRWWAFVPPEIRIRWDRLAQQTKLSAAIMAFQFHAQIFTMKHDMLAYVRSAGPEEWRF